MSAGCEQCARLEALLREAEFWMRQPVMSPDRAFAIRKVRSALGYEEHSSYPWNATFPPPPGDTEPEIERVPRGFVVDEEDEEDEEDWGDQ